MYCITVVLVIVVNAVASGQDTCDISKCYPFYSECSNLQDPPVFAEITFFTQRL